MCRTCAITVRRLGAQLLVDSDLRPAWEWFEAVRTRLRSVPCSSEADWLQPEERLLAVSEWGVLRRSTDGRRFRGFGGISRKVEELVPAGSCRVYLTNRRFAVEQGGRLEIFPLDELDCVTTDARSFVFRRLGEDACYVEFPSQSPLFWELLCRETLRSYWAGRGKEVVEFQPWVRFREQERTLRWDPTLVRSAGVCDRPRDSALRELTYGALRILVRSILRLVFGFQARGLERLPCKGPFVLLLNHEGYLDSFFALAALPVKIGFVAKNTEFAGPIKRAVMRLFRSIPVHRHRPDPVALRQVVRLLQRGSPVAIFPEGERTWDGRRLPPKRSVVKLLIRAGVPIVPCRIEGSFAVLPRWDHKLRRHRVTLWVGHPFQIPRTIGTLDEAARYIGERIDELGRVSPEEVIE
ncbi:MAG: 1-acyl-sn-glycerol-3-phosphate acyltransferase [candidate division KSB1 bacterium]|nr:1-acyl-sn-glycerol-3-phosphate acyltransferase [candidate division KSB1 bacterium]